MHVEYRKYLFLCKFAIIFWSNASLPFFFNYVLFYKKVQKFKFSIFISSTISNVHMFLYLYRNIFTFQNILYSQYFEWILYYVWLKLPFYQDGIFFLKIIIWYKMHKLVNSKGENTLVFPIFVRIILRVKSMVFFLNCRI